MDNPPTAAAAAAALSHWAAQHPAAAAAAAAAVPNLADLTLSSGKAYAQVWCGGSPQAWGRACQASWGGKLDPAKACRAHIPLLNISTFFV